MARLFKVFFFFLLISTASVSTSAGSFYVNVGWYPTSYYSPFGLYSYFPSYDYYRRSVPVYQPVKLPQIASTQNLIALGEAKKEAWFEAHKKRATTPYQITSITPQDNNIEMPEIKVNETKEW